MADKVQRCKRGDKGRWTLIGEWVNGMESVTGDKREKTEKLCVVHRNDFAYAQLANNQFLCMLSQRVTNFHACSANEYHQIF
jgi:hypothetical protein